MKRHGFTLIEMLVVIGLIMFLIGMLGVMLLGGTRNAKIKATQALIQDISMALQQYEAPVQQ